MSLPHRSFWLHKPFLFLSLALLSLPLSCIPKRCVEASFMLIYINIYAHIYLYIYTLSLLHLICNFLNSTKSVESQIHVSLPFSLILVLFSSPGTRTVPGRVRQGLEVQSLQRGGWQGASLELSMWVTWGSWLPRPRWWCWTWSRRAASVGAFQGAEEAPASGRRCSDWAPSLDHCRSVGWAAGWTGHRPGRPGPSAGLGS